MYQFFVEPEQIQKTEVIITGSDVNHIKNVLRMRAGEKVRISDNAGRDLYCEIGSIEGARIMLTIIKEAEGTEPSLAITLFQGLPKGDKMELVIQKAVELGVSEIIPVAMKNCVVKEYLYRGQLKRNAFTETYCEDCGDGLSREQALEQMNLHMEKLEHRVQLGQLMSRMTMKEKEVVCMRAAGYTYREIAEHCNITMRGVSARLLRMRQRLRAMALI